jgi:hypothetical protein
MEHKAVIGFDENSLRLPSLILINKKKKERKNQTNLA